MEGQIVVNEVGKPQGKYHVLPCKDSISSATVHVPYVHALNFCAQFICESPLIIFSLVTYSLWLATQV